MNKVSQLKDKILRLEKLFNLCYLQEIYIKYKGKNIRVQQNWKWVVLKKKIIVSGVTKVFATFTNL